MDASYLLTPEDRHMFLSLSIIKPSTSDRDSISFIPSSEPRTKTLVERASACTPLSAMMVTLMHGLAEKPVLGSMM
jgi:hypothetical protein